MALIADVLSWLCLVAGSALALIGGLGLLRLPDVFARMHSAGLIDNYMQSGITVGERVVDGHLAVGDDSNVVSQRRKLLHDVT